jgi:hypothetical protein
MSIPPVGDLFRLCNQSLRATRIHPYLIDFQFSATAQIQKTAYLEFRLTFELSTEPLATRSPATLRLIPTQRGSGNKLMRMTAILSPNWRAQEAFQAYPSFSTSQMLEDKQYAVL